MCCNIIALCSGLLVLRDCGNCGSCVPFSQRFGGTCQRWEPLEESGSILGMATIMQEE